MKLIIYASKYGNTKRYAEELAKRCGAVTVDFKKVKNINDYDTVIFLGSVFASRLMGLKKAFKNLNCGGKKIIIASVGVADPAVKENTDVLKKGISGQVSAEIFENAKIFHLRGGIDYSEMGFVDKLLLKFLYNKIKDIPEEKQTSEIKTMIETYNKTVDYIDFSSLNEIINEI